MDWIKELLITFGSYLAPCWVVAHYQKGIRLRFGKNPVLKEPGIYRKWPFADIYYCVNVKEDTLVTKPIHFTTTDGKTATASVMVEFIIEDALKHQMENNDAPTNLSDMAASVGSDVLQDCEWNECRKKSICTEIKNKLQKKADKMGYKIISVALPHLCISRVIITRV